MNHRSFMTHSGLLFQRLVNRLTASSPSRPNMPDSKNRNYRTESKCTSYKSGSVSICVEQFAKYKDIHDAYNRSLLYAIGFYNLMDEKRNEVAVSEIQDKDDILQYQYYGSISFLDVDLIEARRSPKVKKWISVNNFYINYLLQDKVYGKGRKVDLADYAIYEGEIVLPKQGRPNKVKIHIFDRNKGAVVTLANTIEERAKEMQAEKITVQEKLF